MRAVIGSFGPRQALFLLYRRAAVRVPLLLWRTLVNGVTAGSTAAAAVPAGARSDGGSARRGRDSLHSRAVIAATGDLPSRAAD